MSNKFRRHFREVLKQQMSDHAEKNRAEYQTKIQESVDAVENDRQSKMKDIQDIVSKFSYLKTFRDHNKTYMEESWQRARNKKAMMDMYDREVLRYNPINWSGTLT